MALAVTSPLDQPSSLGHRLFARSAPAQKPRLAGYDNGAHGLIFVGIVQNFNQAFDDRAVQAVQHFAAG